MERINALLGEGSEVFFIVGADSLMYLEKWYDAKRLFEITDFAVIPREGYDDADCAEHIKKLEAQYGARIKYIDAAKLDHSSTEIRVNPEASVLPMTTKEVYKYIKENNLYG
jgi:nicotinate-nucleotide adenylyltransferase